MLGIRYEVTHAVSDKLEIVSVFSSYFGPSSSVKNFERSFFTFLRSFWKMNILTMQLSTMDGDIPDLMMLMPACLRKSLVLLATVFFP